MSGRAPRFDPAQRARLRFAGLYELPGMLALDFDAFGFLRCYLSHIDVIKDLTIARSAWVWLSMIITNLISAPAAVCRHR